MLDSRRSWRLPAAGWLLAWTVALAQPSPAPAVTPDLAALAARTGWRISNRAVAPAVDEGRRAVRFDENPGEGVALLERLDFESGEIEFDVKGQDVDQHSFVGVAFHAADDRSYEAIYFRPFNFRAADPVRRVHAVQYESQPLFPWKRLRAERPNEFEQPVTPVPDPNGWFHARVVVRDGRVRVFVNGASTPSLDVAALGSRRSGRVGFWVGDESGGLFANLAIRSDLK